jgi:hypothetical protein
MPGLPVRRAGGQPAGFDDPDHEVLRNRFVLILADRHRCADDLEDLIRHTESMVLRAGS